MVGARSSADDFSAAAFADRVNASSFDQTYHGGTSPEQKAFSYLRNIGFRRRHLITHARQAIDEGFRAAGKLDEGSCFDQYGLLRPEFMSARDRAIGGFYGDPIVTQDVMTIRPSMLNEFYDPDFPAALKYALRPRNRPPFEIFSAANTAVYADSCGMQVYNGDLSGFYTSASPFNYSNLILDCRQLLVDRPIVMIGDGFDGTNICHFLLDWVPRLLAFCSTMPASLARSAIFPISAIPSAFHGLVLDAVFHSLGYRPDVEFVSSARLLRTSQSAYWFSNCVRYNDHPGQLMDGPTVDLLRSITQQMKLGRSRGWPSKLYISRLDAKHRRPVDEPKLAELLQAKGFQIANMSNISWIDQMAMVANADVIVAPHGMGLTHLAFCSNPKTVIELFHPTRGTDAYAVLARSLGLDYHYIVGEAADGGNFNISWDDLTKLLA